jgi:hypothetical protein
MNKFIAKSIKGIATACAAVGMVGIAYGGYFALLAAPGLGLFVYIAYTLFKKPIDQADNRVWFPPMATILRVLAEMPEALAEQSCSRGAYLPEMNDCDDMAVTGLSVFHQKLLKIAVTVPEAIGKGHPLHIFSFRRRNGKYHRLFYIINSKGERVYIENYPVFDEYHDKSGMIRELNAEEEHNGHSLK